MAAKKTTKQSKPAKTPKATKAAPVQSSTWQSIRNNTRLRRVVKLGIIPALIYFLLFCLFTWPWITHFNGWFFTDGGDGQQNVWNMWWIDKSVVGFHQLPWHTSYLHAPYGITLVGQTLNPINGFTGIVLEQFMSLTQAFNTMITFSFVFGGLTMFWLCRYFTRSYIPSIIGGAVFTFSSYHFAHAIGHMQLVSLEFIPLFILLWWKLILKPNYKLAVGASVTLLLVLFCDYYYFLYSLILSAMILGYLWHGKRLPDFRKRINWLPMLAFVGLCLLIVAPLPVALLRLNSHEVLRGSHDARVFSTDLASPFIDGGFWRFGELTHRYYDAVKGFVSETTIYMGISVLAVLAVAVWKRSKIHRDAVFWIIVGLFFGIMSLGPRPLLHGNTIESIPMPYVLMEKFVPGMKLSGVPVRMMVMVTFAAAILVAMVLAKVNTNRRQGKLIIAAFCLLFVVEMAPSQLPFTPNAPPQYVVALKSLPAGTVLDDAAKSEPQQLQDQTIHQHKMILGYVSRIPQSLVDKETPMTTMIVHQDYGQLCGKYSLRYITTPAWRPLKTNFPIVYQDKQATIYDIKTGPGC